MKTQLSVLALLTLALVPSALGHAEPIEASPGWNERLDESPTEVVVVFTESVYEDGSWIRVHNLAGERVDLDDLRITPGTRPVMRISLPPLEDGGYLIRWQTYSQTDGHTIAGAIGFSIGDFAPPQTSGAADDARPWAVLARALTYLGYVAAIGALAFQWFVLRTPPSRNTKALDVALLAGAGLQIIGVAILTADTAAATGIGTANYLASAGGRALVVRGVVAVALLLLGSLWLLGPVRPKIRYHILGGLWVAAVALGAQLGHAPGVAAWIMQVLHGVAIAAWVGALAFLVALLRRVDTDEDGVAAARRFGTLGIAATSLMAVTGIYLAATIVGSDLLGPRGAFSNPWRAVLSWKIILALAMICMAAINKFVLLNPRPSKLADWLGKTRRAGLRRLAGVEVGFGIIIIVLAGALMSLAAPTDSLESQENVLHTSAQGFDFNGALTIDPEPREAQFHLARLYLEDINGEPLLDNSCAEGRNDCVSIRWFSDADGEAAAQLAIGVPEGDGWWRFEDLLFASAGNHTMLAEVSSAYAYEDLLRFEFSVLRSQ